MLAASAAVLYFGTGRSLGSLRFEGAFSPDATTAMSIVLVGVAYAVVVCASRLTSATPVEATDVDPDFGSASRALRSVGPALAGEHWRFR
jgi:hypothetical protein